jgi:hypothetical protein
MHQIMRILAEDLVNVLVSQSAEAGRVAERASVLEINSINGFGSGVEKKSKFILTLATANAVTEGPILFSKRRLRLCPTTRS